MTKFKLYLNIPNFKQMRQFVCVDYPAFVQNDAQAIRSLGGMNRIEQTFQRRNRKLFLNFTPDNLFAKSVCSNLIESSTISLQQPSKKHHVGVTDPEKSNNLDEINEEDNKPEVKYFFH